MRLQQAQTRSNRTAGLEVGRFLKAQVSSGVATALDWGLMTVLILAGVYYVTAAVIGAVAGAITDFSVKKWWVFDAGKRSTVEGQAARYALVSGIGAALNAGLSYALVDGLRIHKNIGVLIASTIVGFGWNYPMHRLYVFRPRKRN
ncbi:MAG TPA: GtrA family protein [Myxococcaceae bacterium]|nr:GtrA family protein [Myxococcaceae bacterium]